MRLAEIEAPVTELRGVGEATARNLAALGVHTCGELLLHLPRDYENRKDPTPLRHAFSTGFANTQAEVVAHDYIGRGPKKTLKVYVRDESATAALVCFNRNFLAKKLVPGRRIALFGQFRYQYGELQSTSFDFALGDGNHRDFGRIIPIYPATEGMNQRTLRGLTEQCLKRWGAQIEDDLSPALRRRKELMSKREALQRVHYPESLEQAQHARRALAYEELFVLQTKVARRALQRHGRRGAPKALPDALQKKLRRRLSFRLTEGQEEALAEIQHDMGSSVPMARLLQGDVGSGKTLVAFLAALPYVELGYQIAFMAPTELLARQHAETAAALLEPLGVRLGLLSGNLGEQQRQTLLDSVAAGRVDIVIGTHAVFTEQVRFCDLRLVIIDEQHRFGVLQRAALMEKGTETDLLLMTATPIPRTLALTAFGDMETSTIRTMPPGRKPVETHLARHGNEQKVYDWVRRELAKGHQAYFVYPLIEQSEKLNLKDAESMFDKLQKEVFPEFRLALIHSRVGEQEKAERMEAFVAGRVDVLVATSVVEVGVDVPNATCIVVDHAERFGLAGLHQLRGRVGRGPDQAYAFFVYANDLTEEGKQRLRVLLEHSDGFRIAEEDLNIRGPGDLSGIKQSGFVRLRVADLAQDMELMREARSDAFALLEEDPGLLGPEHTNLRQAVAEMPDPMETTA